MPYIDVAGHLPGITGLLEYRQDTALPIRVLTQEILRGENTLTEGERELIAAYVSSRNGCRFCTAAHKSAADILLQNTETCSLVLTDPAMAPVSGKMKHLLQLAGEVQTGGHAVHEATVAACSANGASDKEIHDTVLIAALFCLYNKYVDGLATVTPAETSFYETLGQRITSHGYNRLPGGYDHMKKDAQGPQPNTLNS